MEIVRKVSKAITVILSVAVLALAFVMSAFNTDPRLENVLNKAASWMVLTAMVLGTASFIMRRREDDGLYGPISGLFATLTLVSIVFMWAPIVIGLGIMLFRMTPFSLDVATRFAWVSLSGIIAAAVCALASSRALKCGK
jgi:hypothetical protein